MGAYRFYSFHWLSTTQQNNENGADYFIALLSTTQQNNENGADSSVEWLL